MGPFVFFQLKYSNIFTRFVKGVYYTHDINNRRERTRIYIWRSVVYESRRYRLEEC